MVSKMSYWLNLAIAIDQLFNALFGGACDKPYLAELGDCKKNDGENDLVF